MCLRPVAKRGLGFKVGGLRLRGVAAQGFYVGLYKVLSRLNGGEG